MLSKNTEYWDADSNPKGLLLCSYPDNVVNAFVKEARKAGVDIFRVFDSLNYVDNIKFGLDAVHAANGVAEGTICYTGDIMDPKRSGQCTCFAQRCVP